MMLHCLPDKRSATPRHHYQLHTFLLYAFLISASSASGEMPSRS